MDKSDIEKIISDRKIANEKFIAKNSKVYKLFNELNKEAFLDGSLSKMQKELSKETTSK